MVSSLNFGTGAAHIQATLVFVACSADALQSRAAAGTTDMKGVCGNLCILGEEPEVVRHHFLKPHTALRFDCVSVERGDHCRFLCVIGVAIDERVISDIGHGLHHSSVIIEEPSSAVSHSFCFRTEKHSGQAPLYLPDVQNGIPSNDDGNAVLGLEKHLTLVAVTGKVLGTVLFDNRLSAEKEFESHFSAPFAV